MDSAPKSFQREPHFEMVNGEVLSHEEGKRLRAAYRDGWLTGWHEGWRAAPLAPYLRERMAWEDVQKLAKAVHMERIMSRRIRFWMLVKWSRWTPGFIRQHAIKIVDKYHDERTGQRRDR